MLSRSTLPNIVTVLKLIVGKKVWRDWNLRLPEIPFNEQRYFTTEESVGPVFQTRNGTPFSNDNVRRKLPSVLNDLNLKRGGLHAFRHSRVSFLRKSGVADKIVPDCIGHSTLRMADLSTHFKDADRRQVADDLGALKGVSPTIPPAIAPMLPNRAKLQRNATQHNM